MIRIFFALFTMIFCCDISSQIVQGTISSNNLPVYNASIILKKNSSSKLIFQYANTDKNGYFNFSLKNSLDSLIIEIKHPNYETETRVVYNLQAKAKHTINIELLERANQLQEVIIEEKFRPIRIKNDTIVYDPEKFKDGTERVVEDLLRKLPGIKVEENGEIKFKGKPIKKMLLDGDDLFDRQYTIGSKNINVDIIDKVEAIDNYNENSLLKGFLNDDEVAINLKLKKGKSDWSGNMNLGYGIQDKYQGSATALLINQSIKAFAITSYNNIGINNSPYDFQSNIKSLEDRSDEHYLSPEIINSGQFYSQLENKFHKINNDFYSSINSLHKLSNKISIKLNAGLYSDKLKRDNFRSTTFFTDQDNFSFSENEKITKSPLLYHLNLYLSNKEKKNFHWEYLGKVRYQNSDFNSLSSNNGLVQNNSIKSNLFLTKHDLNFTKKIQDNNAITGALTYSKSRAPQVFQSLPGISIDETFSDIIKSNQESSTEKDVINLKSFYFKKLQNFQLNVAALYEYQQNKIVSKLKLFENSQSFTTPHDFLNNNNYRINKTAIGMNFLYSKKAFTINSGVALKYFDLEFSKLKRNDFVLLPNASFSYLLTKKSNLLFSYDYLLTTPKETHLFEGIIQTNFRSFQNNEAQLDYLKSHRFSLNYNFNDFFNLTRYSISLNYNKRNNDYITQSLISNNISLYTSTLLNSGNKDYNLNISGEKYIHNLKTTYNFATTYSINFDKNIVNNSELRDIKSNNFFLELSARKGGKSKLFLENKLSYYHSSFKADNSKANKYSSFKNTLKGIYRFSDNFMFTNTFNFIATDLSTNNNYYFLDSEIVLISKNKKFNYSLIGRNLTNNKTFTTLSISDYSNSVSSHNLIERFVMASVSFRF
jgi:hypothetical protein